VIDLINENIDKEKYILADYFVEAGTNLEEAALEIAIGQSVGNPKVRSVWETDELFETHSCFITFIESKEAKSGRIQIAFPIVNTDFYTDGVSHLICQLMGGQLDIANIRKCHLLNLEFPKSVKDSFVPGNGIKAIRGYTGVHDKPLLGGIIKPKTGLDANVLRSMVLEMVRNGVNFIKEDEIMANLPSFPLGDRVSVLSDIISRHDVVYAFCINTDPHNLAANVKTVGRYGGNGVHINVHSGLGSYRSIRMVNSNIFIHFQKSGDRLFTNPSHDYHIKWRVICQLAVLSGVDFIHAGMIGGYAHSDEAEVIECCKILVDGGVIPALSCGMHPGIVDSIRHKMGNDWMANVGGALHGHPSGTGAGVRAMRQAIDGDLGPEYHEAIKKWGFVNKD
jgi:ribulose-bisphosphate carboxylase large chain